MTSALLKIDNLDVNFQQGDKLTSAARNVSLEINRGETVALIGESGSGKSVTALSILQLLPYPIAKHSDKSSIQFNGRELVGAPEKILRIFLRSSTQLHASRPLLDPQWTVLGRRLDGWPGLQMS